MIVLVFEFHKTREECFFYVHNLVQVRLDIITLNTTVGFDPVDQLTSKGPRTTYWAQLFCSILLNRRAVYRIRQVMRTYPIGSQSY